MPTGKATVLGLTGGVVPPNVGVARNGAPEAEAV